MLPPLDEIDCVDSLSSLWQLTSYWAGKRGFSRMVWFVLHWAKQEMELFPTFPVYFLDTLTRIVSHLIGVTVIASNQK